MSANAWRWTGALLLGFLGGAASVIIASSAFPGWYPLVKGGCVGIAPAIAALRMTLTPKV